MNDLHQRQCSNNPQLCARLSDQESQNLMSSIEVDWQLDLQSQTISRVYGFNNYYQTMAFTNAVAWIAHRQDHHPDMAISYKHCAVTYSTHSVDGLSINDFICAARIDALVMTD